MADVEWFVTLEGTEQGPLSPAQVKNLVQNGAIGPETPIRRSGMERTVAAAQVKGLLPAGVVASVDAVPVGPVQVPQPNLLKPGQPTDSGAQRVRGSVPSTRRMAIVTSEPDSRPVPRAERAAEAATDEPDDVPEDHTGIDAGIEGRAGFGTRLLACLIDQVIVIMVSLAVVAGGLAAGAGVVDGTLQITIVGIAIGLATLLLLVYAPLTEAAMGATLGKKLLGLAVVDLDFRRVRPGAAVLRQVLRLIPLGQMRVLSADRLALHDIMSGTQVVPRHQIRGATARRGGGGRNREEPGGGEAKAGARRKSTTRRKGHRRR